MADKAYCEGSSKQLVWIISIITVAVIVATFYYHKRTSATSVPDPRDSGVGLPPKGNVTQAAVVDGLTHATPKGSFKIIGNMQQPQTRLAAGVSNLPVPLENIQELFNNIAATIKPAVVHIEVMRPAPNTVSGAIVESIGSGIIVDRRGYVLTNYHVLEEALEISVNTYSKAGKMSYDGRLVHSDVGTDLAVIEILGDADFPVAALGRASVLEVGDWVMAIGSPIDLAQTVSLGIVSALRETVRIDGITYSNMIQTDAHINRGNSGGPLVNLYGDVVGVNTAIYTPGGSFTGVGFAMPIDAANNLLDELNIAQHRFVSTVANLNKPQVKHGAWLGIGSVSLTPLLIDHYGVPVDHGAYITEVLAGSPAERAGLKEGDVIVWVDDTLVADVAQLKSVLARKFPGKEIVLSVCRGSQVFDVSAITTEKW